MNIESYKKCSSAISLQGREKSVRKSSIRAGLGQKTFQEKLLYKDPSNDAKVGLTLPLFLNDSIQKNVKEFNIESIEQRNNELIQKVLEIVPSKIEAN